jgi:glycosyltransferase involved in cell wall biosynthesis
MLRILHVVGAMERAGVETWLMHVLRRLDRRRCTMDFLVHASGCSAYDEEIEALGSRVIRCPHPSRPWRYARQLSRILERYGPYDVVHSHVHHFSGLVLRLAARAGVPVRIAHSHTDTREADRAAGALRHAYVRTMRRWIDRYGTAGLATSTLAAEALYGTSWRADPRIRVLPCGIDLRAFQAPCSRESVRARLGIPEDALVLGHVGRFAAPKNQAFVVRVAESAALREPRLWLLLVGEGPLRPAVERAVAEGPLRDRVRFTGARADVVELLQAATDVFVLPSRVEGLGLALVEAQAAGVPCVVSDVVPAEVDVVPPLVRRLPLSAAADTWAAAALAMVASGGPPRSSAWRLLAGGPFDVTQSVRSLLELYGDIA